MGTLLTKMTQLVLLLLLTACGNSTPPPANLTMTANSIPSVVKENAITTFTFSVSGVEGKLIPTVTSENLPTGSTITTKTTSHSMTVSVQVADELYANQTGIIHFSLLDKRTTADKTVTYDANVTIDNVSGQHGYDRLMALNASLSDLIKLSRDKDLLNKMLTVASLFDPNLSLNLESSLQLQMTQLANDVNKKTEFDTLTKDIADTGAKYLAGKIVESSLMLDTTRVQLLADKYGTASHDIIAKAIKSTRGNVDPIPYNGIYVSDDGTILSQFIGNTALGKFEQGAWVFNENVAYLKTIVYANSQTCTGK